MLLQRGSRAQNENEVLALASAGGARDSCPNCSDPASSVLVMSVSRNAFHVVSALQSPLFVFELTMNACESPSFSLPAWKVISIADNCIWPLIAVAILNHHELPVYRTLFRKSRKTEYFQCTVNSRVSDHPWCKTKWSLNTGSVVVYRKNQQNKPNAGFTDQLHKIQNVLVARNFWRTDVIPKLPQRESEAQM